MKPKADEDTKLIVSRANVTRASIYSFLSRSFKSEVDERLLQEAAEMQRTVAFLSESQRGQELKDGSRMLDEFTKHVGQRKDDERKRLFIDLAAEYADLFLGVGPRPVHLVESVYLSKDHLLFQEPYFEVSNAYKSLGFEKEKDFLEPEDHVAVEFEFMAKLCRWTSQLLDEGDVKQALAYINLQNEFLRDHIVRWVPDLCSRLKEAATSDFYRGVAHLTNGFIALDSEVPDHLTETLRQAASAN